MAEKIASITAIPVVYEKGATGSYILDSRGDKKVLKIGDNVEKTDDWESVVYGEFINTPKVYVHTNLAEYNMTKEELDVIVPKLLDSNIKPSLMVYDDFNAFGYTAGFTLNVQTYKAGMLNVLNGWSGATLYKEYFNDYPSQFILDWEPQATNYINGDVDPTDATVAGISCASAIEVLKSALIATKEIAPYSTVYEYSCPSLPYYFQSSSGNSSNWYSKNPAVSSAQYNAEKDRLLTQQRTKINLFKQYSDLIDMSAYVTYSEGISYGNIGISNLTKEWVYNQCYSAAQALDGKKGTSIHCSSVVFPGSEYVLREANGQGVSLAYIQALPSLVTSDEHVTFVALQPAKTAGVRYLMLWDSWKYNAVLAARAISGTSSGQDADTYVNRKLVNDLFIDTGVGTTLGLQDDASWALTSTKLKILEAATEKTINLANAFRQI